ncbi:MAG: DUF3822 family protein [Bacteroidales bacterium]
MQVQSIISKSISEEILSTGHLSIRFMSDGFSLLLEDTNYNPVVLNRFFQESSITQKSHVLACEDWLNRHTLFDGFKGEVSFVIDKLPTAMVPSDLFSKKDSSLYLEPETQLHTSNTITHKTLKDRPLVMVFPVPEIFSALAGKFTGVTRIMSTVEVLISMADQVNAADHQRGFTLVDLQNQFLGILMIRDDKIQLANQCVLKKSDDLVYHTLNSIKQLDFNRKKAPIYYTGVPGDDSLKVLRKYIRHVKPLFYHIIDLEKSHISEHVVLAEATKCE